jgi:hypothetical protein
VFILNRVPTKSVKRTPYEIWTQKRSGLSFFKVWGCEAYVKRLMSDKLTSKLDKCFFVGYPREIKGHYFYNKLRAKYLSLAMMSSMRKGFFLKELVGVRWNLKKFKKY